MEEEKENDIISNMLDNFMIDNHGVQNTYPMEHPSTVAPSGLEVPTSMKSIISNMKITIINIDQEEMEIVFDIIGVEAPLVNALRRILISEVPTIAIEKVTLHQNTSVIPDEVLCHRLGLIPIKVDPRLFQFRAKEEEYNSENCVKFILRVKCYRDEKTGEIINSNIYTSHLKWEPLGDQESIFPNDGARPVQDDIILCKMRPGQEINMELFCEKGIGQTHAKWSPVSTAYYRLMPKINITQQVTGDDAQEIVNLCPMKVFEIEDIEGVGILRANNERNCTTCRECIREQKYQKYIQLEKVKNHFEFHIESVGIYQPEELLGEALKVLKDKGLYWKNKLDEVATK